MRNWATRILCFPSHVDASILREATSLNYSETRMDNVTASHQPVEHPCSYTNASSGVQLRTRGDFLLQDDIDSLDYIIEDTNWIWSEDLSS
ncbi:hypothetical protein ACQKWADRAFT_26465 [Trichoderma austrokoningii]